MADLTPYSTARSMMGPLPSWLPPDDAERISAYQVYESLYRNVPDAFKLVQRGSDQNPIYIPNARTLIEATNRFLAKNWTFALDPKMGTPEERELLQSTLTNVFRREQVHAKFATQKRYGLVRGDSIWHLTVDEDKEPGKRISLYEIDPAEYFPIHDEEDNDRLVGCHLVTQFVDGDATIIRRQTYRKEDDGGISYELSWWELSAWDDRTGSGQELKKVNTPSGQEAISAEMLNPLVTSIPVYHVKNNRVPGSPFGASELEGLERIFGAVNQAISDEEVALAMDGLGLYATTSGPPVDENDEEINWRIGPGYVVEIDEGTTWERVSGVTSVAPNLDHIQYLEKSMRNAAGVPDIAIGNVDTAVAQSGIALSFHMGPLLAKNEEKELEILSVMDHMLYDITTMWLPAYEQLSTAAQAVSIVGDPLPVDRQATLAEITSLVDKQLISISYAQQLLSEKLGYEFPDEMLADVVEEQAALAEARNFDPFAARVARELDGDGA